MDVNSHVIFIDENGIPYTMSIINAKPVPTESPTSKKITHNYRTAVETTLPRNEISECNEPMEYVAESVVDHRHASEDMLDTVYW